MPGTWIHVALASDFERIVQLAHQAAPERGVGGSREALVEDSGDPESLVLVAEVGGEVVAYGRSVTSTIGRAWYFANAPRVGVRCRCRTG